MRASWAFAGVLLACAAVPAMAADQKLTLTRVFGNPDLAGVQPRGLKLSPDGTLLTSLKPRPDEKERFDLWALDTRTGQERMLVDSKKVGSGAGIVRSREDAARARAHRRFQGHRRL